MANTKRKPDPKIVVLSNCPFCSQPSPDLKGNPYRSVNVDGPTLMHLCLLFARQSAWFMAESLAGSPVTGAELYVFSFGARQQPLVKRVLAGKQAMDVAVVGVRGGCDGIDEDVPDDVPLEVLIRDYDNEEGEDEDTPYYCQKCDYHSTKSDFESGVGEYLVCPKCGDSTEVFLDTEKE